MANPRRLDFNGFDGFRDNGFIPNPSMIPYIQSSQPNGGKANARNALLLWKRLKFGTKCVGYLCLPKDYQNKRPYKLRLLIFSVYNHKVKLFWFVEQRECRKYKQMKNLFRLSRILLMIHFH